MPESTIGEQLSCKQCGKPATHHIITGGPDSQDLLLCQNCRVSLTNHSTVAEAAARLRIYHDAGRDFDERLEAAYPIGKNGVYPDYVCTDDYKVLALAWLAEQAAAGPPPANRYIAALLRRLMAEQDILVEMSFLMRDECAYMWKQLWRGHEQELHTAQSCDLAYDAVDAAMTAAYTQWLAEHPDEVPAP